MKKLLNITIIWQMIFSVMLYYPQNSLATDSTTPPPASDEKFEPPTPEDVPFEYPDEAKKDNIDKATHEAMALNFGMTLAAIVGAAMTGILNPPCLRIPSVLIIGPASIVFIIREIMFMSEYQKLQSDELKNIKTNVDLLTKNTQEATIAAALEETKRGLSFAENKYNWALAYRVFIIIALIAALLEVVAANFPVINAATRGYLECFGANDKKIDVHSPVQKIVQHFGRFVGINDAHAISSPSDWLTAMGLPVATAAAIVVTALINKKLLQHPEPRAGFLAVMLILSFVNIGMLKDVVDAYKSRRDKLVQLRDSIKVGQGKKIDDKDPNAPPPAPAPVKPPTAKPVPKGTADGEGPCVANGSDGPSADPNCEGPALEVKPLDAKYANILGPEGMSAASVAQTATNALAKGNNATGKAGLVGYSKNKNATRDLMRKALADINKQKSKMNKPPFDITADSSKILSDSKAALLKAIADTPGASLASLGTFTAPPADKEELAKESGTAVNNPKVAAIPSFQIPTSMNDSGMGSSEAGVNDSNTKKTDVNTADALKGKNLNMNDINKNKDVSIFTVLTVRYKISAYPKFFQKSEVKKAELPKK